MPLPSRDAPCGLPRGRVWRVLCAVTGQLLFCALSCPRALALPLVDGMFNPDTQIPAGFRPTYDSATCNDAFYHLEIPADCRDVDLADSPHREDLSVKLCLDPPTNSSGMVIFLDSAHDRSNTTRVYRGRMVGREVFTLPITYCNTRVAVGTFSVTMPGTYHLELLQLYNDFNYRRLTGMHADLRLAHLDLDVRFVDRWVADSHLDCVGDNCPLCHHTDVTGRWVGNPEHTKGLEHTCFPDHAGSTCHRGDFISPVPAAIDNSILRWQPYGCSLTPHAEHVTCMKHIRKLCVFGDSHSRHLFNSMVRPDFLTNDSWHYEATDKTIEDHPGGKYYQVRWGDDFDLGLLDQCTTIVFNWGQWAVSNGAHRYENNTRIMTPWTAFDFIERMDFVARLLQGQQQQGKRVFWLTLPSMCYIGWFTGLDDFRTDPNLLLLNMLAYEMMQRYSIPVIDLWTMSDTLKDLAYDTAHYKGYVGHWMAAAVAHEVCAHPGLHGRFGRWQQRRATRHPGGWQPYSAPYPAQGHQRLC